MTFTADELRRLSLGDLAEEDLPLNRKGGRPRKPYRDEKTARRRAQWRAYIERRNGRRNAFNEPRIQGGRPRTRPNTAKSQQIASER